MLRQEARYLKTISSYFLVKRHFRRIKYLNVLNYKSTRRKYRYQDNFEVKNDPSLKCHKNPNFFKKPNIKSQGVYHLTHTHAHIQYTYSLIWYFGVFLFLFWARDQTQGLPVHASQALCHQAISPA